MTDSIPSEIDSTPEIDRETIACATAVPFELSAAYALGYADGRLMLSGKSEESLPLIRARIHAHVDAVQPSAAEQAYVAGVRDAVADNFPSPPQEPHQAPQRHAA